MCFLNYRLWKSLLENSLNITVSEQALAVKMWKCRKCFLISMRALLSIFFFSFWVKFIWKICPSELGEILRLFVNTLTADGKYPVQSCKNLQLPIQMQLSENWSTFSELFVLFPQSTSNFKHFEKNKIVIANVFPKL